MSLTLLIYIGFAWNTLRGLDSGAQRLAIPALVGGAIGPGGVLAHGGVGGTAQNLLIVGNDDRSTLSDAQVRELKVGRNGGSLNTDTMMLVHIPADGSQVTLISLPRDAYVAIPGHGMNRLNAAYAYGYHSASGTADARRGAGADLLIRTVENLTGLRINHFVLTSLYGFVTISDAIGGVPINLCHDVDDTVAYNRSIGGNGGSGFQMSKGHHVIKGVQALEFVRQRHNLPNGDLDRTARQRYFLAAAFRTVASAGTLLDPERLARLVHAVNRSVYIDAGLNMLDLARQMANLSANNIRGKLIPFVSFWNNSPVGSVERIDPAAVRAFVRQLVAPPDPAYLAAKLLAPGAVAVSVGNGGAANGTAARTAAALHRFGFRTVVDTRTLTAAATEIRYPPGAEAQAKTVARYLPGAVLDKTTTAARLEVVMTGDGTTVHPPAGHRNKSRAQKTHTAIDSGCIN